MVAFLEKIRELAAETGSKNKQKIIEDNIGDENFRQFLYYALNPFLSYNLSEKTLRDTDGFSSGEKLVLFDDIFSCCEYLSRLRGIDNATVKQVKTFLYDYTNEEEREFYIKLLSKTLRLGVTAKSVNKVCSCFLPEWEVQQAYPIEKYPLKKGEEFWLTQKLNGTRATFYGGQLVARSGEIYTGLDHITAELENFPEWVFDGELTLKDKGSLSDNEAFRVATGIINSDVAEKKEICFTIFDMVSKSEFDSFIPSATYTLRRKFLNIFSNTGLKDAEYCSVLPVLYHGKDHTQIEKYLDQMVSEDKEGLMLNTDCPYRRARHKGILKIKRFYTMDLPIIRCEEGSGRLSGTLGALVLDFKGNEVSVGSGFTDEQREVFWDRKNELEGMICEVKYKEVSADKKTGNESLQFPVFVTIRKDKTEVNYE